MQREIQEASALGAFVFAIFALGACPTIYVGDSGELVAAVHTLGIPHPSGYPLYVLLGKLWTLLLPWGTIAWRMSLFSAACGAAACGTLYVICRSLALHRVAAAAAALLLAFGPSFWSQATVQRVYCLNTLFVALATAAAFAWFRSREGRPLGWAFFVCGLGACNHTFMAVYAVALALFVAVTEPAALRLRRTHLLPAAAFLPGLLPYLYLPLRSRSDPALDWGDPESLVGFVRVVGRSDFWGRAWTESLADFGAAAADFLHSLGSELMWVGAAAAIFGAIAGARRGWPVALPLLVGVANFASVALHGSRTDIFVWHRYHIPAYFMGALLAGMGFQLLLDRLPRPARLLPLALPLVLLVMGHRDFDRSRYRIAEDYSRTLLASLPEGAHLGASSDNVLFVLIYLHLVEGVRPDIDLIMQDVGGANPPDLHFDPDTDALFFTHHPNWDLPELELAPRGLVFRVVRAGRPPSAPNFAKTELVGENDDRVPKDFLTRNLIGHFHYMRGLNFERSHWLEAERQFELAAAAAPDNDALFYNLGLTYRRNGRLEEAIAAFERSAAINPRSLATASGARASDRLQELRRQQSVGLEPARGASGLKRLHAAQLAEAAALAARRHEYAAAMQLLDQAEVLAPESVQLLQYRSNVAFLMGDREAARRALERALELDPENALFRHNLEQLQQPGGE